MRRCEFCNRRLRRKIGQNGIRESEGNFLARRFCDNSCSNSHRCEKIRQARQPMQKPTDSETWRNKPNEDISLEEVYRLILRHEGEL